MTMNLPEYNSLAEFYAAQRDRAASGEADYGVHWQVNGRSWPQWRVSYIRLTGEIYATEQHGPCRVRVLGIVPADPDERTNGETQVRGTAWSYGPGGTYYRTLDTILDGWADPDVSGFDLAWIERKLADHKQEG